MGTVTLNMNSIFVPCPVCEAICMVVKTVLEDSRTVMHPESCGACIKANHEDFVKSHFEPLPEPEHREFIESINVQSDAAKIMLNSIYGKESTLGRPIGSLDITKRADSHCSRCGAVGRRASVKRNGCCSECHHISDDWLEVMDI